MGKIICFGAGQYIVNNQNIILNHEDKLVAIIDNNESKWGNIFMGTSIISPKQILGLDYDLIVITSICEDEIRKQLKLLGVSDKKIFSLMEYKARLFAINQRKNKNYKTADTYKVNFDGKKIVYTAIMGEYDNLLDPAVINQDVDYVCFTNNKRLKSDIWNHRQTTYQTMG